ncbi:hypothetical protein P8452_35855 [Trifolium repens]|nr:hypothetical protein P8452_35855 [Trifolium repens]
MPFGLTLGPYSPSMDEPSRGTLRIVVLFLEESERIRSTILVQKKICKKYTKFNIDQKYCYTEDKERTKMSEDHKHTVEYILLF